LIVKNHENIIKHNNRLNEIIGQNRTHRYFGGHTHYSIVV